jgi:autotransporter translocation and assembly factor TamB
MGAPRGFGEITRARRRRGRAARVVAWVVVTPILVAVVAVFAAILYARTEGGRDRVRRLVVARAQRAVPGLTMGRIDGDYVRGLSLHDVDVADPEGLRAIHVDSISCRFQLWPLIRRTVEIRELRVTGVRVSARPTADGSLNLTHLTAPSAPPAPAEAARDAKPSAWHLHVRKILVDDVKADVETATGATGTLGTLRLAAALALDGDRLLGRIDQLEIRAAMEGRPVGLSLSSAQLALDAARVAAHVPALRVLGVLPGGPVDVSADLDGPRARIAARVRLATADAGTIDLGGLVALIRDGRGASALGDYELTARIADLDPSRLSPGAPAGRLRLTLSARGAGLPLGRGARASVVVDVAPSRLAGVRIEPGHLAASLAETRWEVGPAALRASGVSLSLAGRGDGLRGSADARADIDGPLPRAGSRLPDVRGRGFLTLHAQGHWPDEVAFRVKAQGRRVVTPAARLGALVLDLQARVTGLQAATATATATVTARAVRLADPALRIDTLALKVADDNGRLRVHAAVAGPRVRGGLDAHGVATPRAADVTLDRLSADFATSAYRQRVALTAPARIRYRAGDRVTVSRTAVHGDGYQFTGDAVLEGEARLTPGARDPLMRLALGLRGASVRGLTPVDADVDATLTRRNATARVVASMPRANAQVRVDASVPVLVSRAGTPRLAARGPIDVRLHTSAVRLQSIPVVERLLARQGISGGTASVDVAVSGDVAHPEASATFDLRDVMYRNVSGIGRDSTLKTVPGLGGSLEIHTHPGAIEVNGQILVRNTGVLKIAARTGIDLGQVIAGRDLGAVPLHASVEIPRLELASLADFTDGVQGMGGQVHGRVDVTGTPRRLSGQADLAIDGARVDKLTFRKVQLHADADPELIRAELSVAETSGGTLSGSASLERGAGQRLTASLAGKDLDVAFASALLPGVREIGGIAQLSLTAKGSARSPRVWASLTLDHGRVGMTGQPTFRDVGAVISLAPGRLDLHRLAMRSGDGDLAGQGWLILGGAAGLTAQRAVFSAHARHFLIAVAGSTGARLDGDLAVDAALRADVLSGKVRVPEANVWLPKGPPTGGGRDLQKISPHDDISFVDQAALAAAERQQRSHRQEQDLQAPDQGPLRLAVEATSGPIYVRGKDLDIEVRSSIEVGTIPSGPRAGAPTLSGAIHIPRGRINIQGQRFDFDHGDVTFDGSPDVNPQLDIKLEHEYPDAHVVIELRGTPKKPQLRLSSDPPIYDQAQILSLILTGQPGGQGASGKPGKPFDPTAAVATAVLSRLADQLAPQLGLDVLRVENQEIQNGQGEATGDKDTRVEVGKYITDRVYLSYAHIFGAPENSNQNEAHVEYRITRRWMLETVFGDAGQGGVDALWIHRY